MLTLQGSYKVQKSALTAIAKLETDTDGINGRSNRRRLLLSLKTGHYYWKPFQKKRRDLGTSGALSRIIN